MIDAFTKFVSCNDPLHVKARGDGSTYTNGDLLPFFIGVNDFDGMILTGPRYRELVDIYGNTYFPVTWSSSVLLPADSFYLAFGDSKEKDSNLYGPRKDRYSLFGGTQSYQKNDNTNDYLLSGQNAIGKTGQSRSYRVYDSDRVTYVTELEQTSDYVNSSDYSNVDFSTWNNQQIYTADAQGRFKNPSETQIEIGYATYTVLMNEGENNEFIARPQKYIDIVFSEIENKWVWGSYKSTSEPIDSNFTMTNDEENVIELVFYMYTFKFQTTMCFDEGGVK